MLANTQIHGSPNCGSWAEFCPLLVLVNKVLLNHSLLIHLHIIYGFHTSTGGLDSCNRDHIAYKTGFA